MRNEELIRTLWSLKNDAEYAYHQALDGSESGLAALGLTIKLLEDVVIRANNNQQADGYREP
jgi:hypothetical protein